MAISKMNEESVTRLAEYTGLSTDDKPEVDSSNPIGSGSIFYELDTGKVFIYSEENENPVTSNNWWEVL
jgi:hypothetical protein